MMNSTTMKKIYFRDKKVCKKVSETIDKLWLILKVQSMIESKRRKKIGKKGELIVLKTVFRLYSELL